MKIYYNFVCSKILKSYDDEVKECEPDVCLILDAINEHPHIDGVTIKSVECDKFDNIEKIMEQKINGKLYECETEIFVAQIVTHLPILLQDEYKIEYVICSYTPGTTAAAKRILYKPLSNKENDENDDYDEDDEHECEVGNIIRISNEKYIYIDEKTNVEHVITATLASKKNQSRHATNLCISSRWFIDGEHVATVYADYNNDEDLLVYADDVEKTKKTIIDRIFSYIKNNCEDTDFYQYYVHSNTATTISELKQKFAIEF